MNDEELIREPRLVVVGLLNLIEDDDGIVREPAVIQARLLLRNMKDAGR